MSKRSAEAKVSKTFALYQKGVEALRLRDYDQVLRIASKLHQARYSGAFELEARARYEMGEPQEATRVLEVGLRKCPNVYLLASYLGEYQSNQGHYQLAIEAFDRARNGEQDVDSYADLNIGICYSRMEMYDRAAEYYAKVNFSPGHHGTLMYLACLAKDYLQTGEDVKFLGACEQGIALANREQGPEFKEQVAWIYAYRAEHFAKQGKRTDAESDLNVAKTLDTHNEQVLRAHRWLYGRRLEKATSYHVFLRGSANGLKGLPAGMGMVAWFYIIAESEADLVRLAQEHAEDWQTWEEIVEIASTQEFENVHEGVTRMQKGGELIHNFGLVHQLRARLNGVKLRRPGGRG